MATAVSPAPPAPGPKRHRKPYTRKPKPPKDASAAPSRRPPRLTGPLPGAARIPGSSVLLHLAPRERPAPPTFRLKDCLEQCDFDLVYPEAVSVVSSLEKERAPCFREASAAAPAPVVAASLTVTVPREEDWGDAERDLLDFSLRDFHPAVMDPLSMIAFEELRETSAGWL